MLFFAFKDCYYIAKNISNGFSAESKNYEAYDNDALNVYDFIKSHTKQSDVIIFFKPRVLYLNTNRLSFTTSDTKRLKEADYVLYYKQSYSFLPESSIDSSALSEIYKNDSFILYKINKDSQ